MEADLPQAEALAILGKDILAVGINEEILALSGSNTQVIDLGGRALLPGFVDPHTHFLANSMDSLEEGQQHTLERGTTTIGDPAMHPGRLEGFLLALESTKLRVRTSLYLMYNTKCSGILSEGWYLDYPAVLDPAQMLRIPGIKIFGDKGGSSCGLMAMSAALPPELVAESGGGPNGDLVLSEEELAQVIAEHQALGYQVVIHARGDRTVDTSLNAIETALAGQPNTFRHRIDHNDFVRPELLSRFGEIGAVPLLRGRPETCMINDSGGIHPYGEEVSPWFYLARSFLDANPGLPVAWHSDDWSREYPRTPILDLYDWVTRKQIRDGGGSVCVPPDWFAAEAITVEEALRLMTSNAAYALFMEEKVGSLKPGKFADLVVLSENPLTVDPDAIRDIDVLMTMVGGRVEHCIQANLCPASQQLLTPAPGPRADIIFFNAQVVTIEPELPQADALAVLAEEILAVGSNEEILDLSGPETQVIDLGGRALLPGFVDTHSHLFNDANQHLGLTLEQAQEAGLRGGTTALADMYVNSGFLDQMYAFEEQGKLKIRTSLYLIYNTNCGDPSGDWWLDHPPILDPTQMLRIPGVKIFSDGGTCRKDAAYSFNLPIPKEPNYPQGNLFLTEEELTDMVVHAQTAGYQAAIHAIGDRGIETVQDALENALAGASNTYRHRIDHNAYLRPDLLSRYGEIGVVASIPNSSACWSELMIDDRGGPTTRSWFTPWRSLLDANPELHVAWQSDVPWWGLGPIPGLFSLVTRSQIGLDGVTLCEAPDWMLDEAITVEEALRLMTIEAAYVLFMEEKIGSLKSGKFADLIILSNNPLTVAPDSLVDLEVLMTMVGGRVEHCQAGLEALCP